MINWLRKAIPSLFVQSLFGKLIHTSNPKIVYGTTTGDETFSNIPVLAPSKDKLYEVAKDLGTIRVLAVNQETNLVVFMERNTGGVFEVETEVFEFLFVESDEKPSA